MRTGEISGKKMKAHIFKDVIEIFHSCFKMQMCSAFEEMSAISAKMKEL